LDSTDLKNSFKLNWTDLLMERDVVQPHTSLPCEEVGSIVAMTQKTPAHGWLG